MSKNNKVVGYYNEKGDIFLCKDCFKELQVQGEYKEVRREDCNSQDCVCDKCGKNTIGTKKKESKQTEDLEETESSSGASTKFISLLLFLVSLQVHFYAVNLGTASFRSTTYKTTTFILSLPTIFIEVGVIAYIFYDFLSSVRKKSKVNNKWFYFLVFSIVSILWGVITIIFPVLS